MANGIAFVIEILSWIVIINVVLSFFMSPYQPLRQALDRIVEPMLSPIRRILPPLGGLDFSPFVLLILLRVLGSLLIQLLR